MPPRTHKVTVLVPKEDFERFSRYCSAKGFKKSTLIVRLIREHLDREGFDTQRALFADRSPKSGK